MGSGASSSSPTPDPMAHIEIDDAMVKNHASSNPVIEERVKGVIKTPFIYGASVNPGIIAETKAMWDAILSGDCPKSKT